jgi:hypothetical protein
VPDEEIFTGRLPVASATMPAASATVPAEAAMPAKSAMPAEAMPKTVSAKAGMSHRTEVVETAVEEPVMPRETEPVETVVEEPVMPRETEPVETAVEEPIPAAVPETPPVVIISIVAMPFGASAEGKKNADHERYGTPHHSAAIHRRASFPHCRSGLDLSIAGRA